ncbi:TetR/AcrR family transcriptional regulator [Parahaliea mediterranea]|uniref:TetR/AcrR family transcriptional regulator n=1 Tax=Parahaliea mediterranea TaxID=651086 RepID=A0A939IL89_9GAMM|nr:TetR/AcrR family transcriptional regulator [Parahaliea mediterranea]MBN7798136.1 TetR/AcrR family transcriptional regulator [Parahaliea mediterranea]
MPKSAGAAISRQEDIIGAPTRRGAQRRKAVLEAALDLFLQDGFAATSLDRVIERAGGSRRTIYQTFGGKEGLLRAAVSEACRDMFESLPSPEQLLRESPEQALRLVGGQFLERLISPRRMALLRLVIAESTHCPELGRTFMASGPERTYDLMLQYFRAAIDAGQLTLSDPEISARQFLELAKGDLHFRALFHNEVADRETQQRYVEAAVSAFLEGARTDC